MTPNTINSAKIFAVVEFLEKPRQDFARYVCVPTSWITQRQPNCRAVVAYPREDVNFTRIRVENNAPPFASWPVFMAVIKYESDDYDDADVWIKMEENKMSANIINLDDDEDDCEPLVYISESDDNEGDQDDSDMLILNEDQSKAATSKSNNNSIGNNIGKVENDGAGRVSAEDISLKSENNINVENNNVDTMSSMEEKSPKSECIVIKDDDDDLDDLEDLIILENNKSDTITVDSRDDNIDDSNKGTGMNHIEYSTPSLNIQTTEESLVETNATPSTPSAEIPHRPTISVVPEHVLRFGCHEQKQISGNSTQGEDGRQNSLERQVAIKIVKSLSSMTKAQISDNTKTANITGNFPHGEAHASNILMNPNDVNHGQKICDPNSGNIFVESGNVPYPVEYNSAQCSRQQNNAPIANSRSKPKKTLPAKKMKSKASTKKVRGYNQTQCPEKRDYTNVSLQGAQIRNISSENIISRALYFQQNSSNQHYQRNVQQLAGPAEHLPVDNVGNIIIKTTTGRNPLTLNALQSNRNTIPISAPHSPSYHPSTGNRFSHQVGSNENELERFQRLQNYTGRNKQTIPAEAVYVHHIIPNQQGTRPTDPVMANYYYNPSYSAALSANQFAPDIRDNSVVHNPHNYSQLSLTRNRYQTIQPSMPSTVTSVNVSPHFPDRLPVRWDVQLPTRQIQQLFQGEPNVMNQQVCDIQRIAQNTLADQGCLNCSCSHEGQFASTTFPSVINTRNSTAYDEQYRDLNPNRDNYTVNLSAVQNQPNETREEQNYINQLSTCIRNSTACDEQCSEPNPNPESSTLNNVKNQTNETRDEQNSIDQTNTGCEQPASTDGMVVANETESRLSIADRQDPAEESSQACSTEEKIEGGAKENQNSSNVSNELANVTVAIKEYERIFSQTEKSIRKQTEAYKIRNNKMLECDNEFNKVIDAVIGYCESRMNEILKSKSKSTSK